MKKLSSGFTIIELIFVIAILGILAGVALPRFINQTTNARKAAINGAAGAIASAVALAQAEYRAEGNSATSTVTTINMDGTTVTVVTGTGTPDSTSATGLGSALQNLFGFAITTGATATVNFSPTATTSCAVQYTGSTGVVSIISNGC